MKIYSCKKCQTEMDKNNPCIFIVRADDNFPLCCPYEGNKAKFKEKSLDWYNKKISKIKEDLNK